MRKSGPPAQVVLRNKPVINGLDSIVFCSYSPYLLTLSSLFPPRALCHARPTLANNHTSAAISGYVYLGAERSSSTSASFFGRLGLPEVRSAVIPINCTVIPSVIPHSLGG